MTEQDDATAATDAGGEAADGGGADNPGSQSPQVSSPGADLGEDPEDWNDDVRNAPTMPIGGFKTPSGSRTPSPQPSPHQHHQPYLGAAPLPAPLPLAQHGAAVVASPMPSPTAAAAVGSTLICSDPWDWKTDAPEFVPGRMAVAAVQVLGAFPGTAPSPTTAGNPVPPAVGEGERLAHLRAQYEWQLRAKSEELQDMQQRMQQTEIETAQLRASWEVERRSLVRQIGHHRAVLERYCIPLDEVGGLTGYLSVAAGGTEEEEAGRQRQGAASWKQVEQLAGADSRTPPTRGGEAANGESPARGGAATSTPRSRRERRQQARPAAPANADMGGDSEDGAEPEAAEERGGAGAPTLMRQLHRLERSTESKVDDRARRALQALPLADALEAMERVVELFDAQGGRVRNVSSILQRVCTKMEKKVGGAKKASAPPAAGHPSAATVKGGGAGLAAQEPHGRSQGGHVASKARM